MTFKRISDSICNIPGSIVECGQDKHGKCAFNEMKRYEIRIEGLVTQPGRIGLAALQAFSQELRQAAQRSVRLVLEGESFRPGPTPDWLAAATDFILTGLRHGSTHLQNAGY